MNRHQAAASLYRRLGWSPGTAGHLVWLRSGRVIDALELPRTLGQRTQRLVAAKTPLFEVIDLEQPHWVFLTQPARRPVDTLNALGVDHITGGRTVDLPPSEYGQSRLHWLVAPTTPLPQFATVAEAIILAAT